MPDQPGRAESGVQSQQWMGIAAIEPDRIQTGFHENGAPAWLARIKRYSPTLRQHRATAWASRHLTCTKTLESSTAMTLRRGWVACPFARCWRRAGHQKLETILGSCA